MTNIRCHSNTLITSLVCGTPMGGVKGLVEKISNQFHFCFPLSQIMVMNLKQR